MMPEMPVVKVSRKDPVQMRAVWSALDAAATPLSTLAVLAALTRALGASDYGILVVVLAASGLSMAINPAIAATTTKFVSELSARRVTGSGTVAGVISTSLAAVGAINVVLLLGTATFSGPLARCLFGRTLVQTRPLGTLLLLAVLVVGTQQVETVLSAALRGLERFRRQALVEVISRTTFVAVLPWIAWRTRSLEAILASQWALYAISIFVRATALARLLPNNRLFAFSEQSYASALFRFGGWMWLTALAGAAYASVDRIIVGRVLGAAAAGQYNIYVQITQLTHFIPSSIFAFSFPAYSRLAAHGSIGDRELARAYRSNLLAISMTGLTIAVATAAFWPLLVRLVTGSEIDRDSLIVPELLILNFLLLAFNVAPYYLLLAMGRARTVSAICTLSMVVSLLLMIVLIPRYGVLGAAASRLAYGTGALSLLVISHRAMRESS